MYGKKGCNLGFIDVAKEVDQGHKCGGKGSSYLQANQPKLFYRSYWKTLLTGSANIVDAGAELGQPATVLGHGQKE